MEGQIEAFQRDGFVVIPDLLTDDELDTYGAAVDEAVAARTAADTRTLAEKSRYEQSFLQCMNLWEDMPDVRPLTFHQGIGSIAASLIGAPALRVWHDQALYKEAGGRETDAHQDFPYWPLSEADALTAWIPFEGSNHDSGVLGYLPGSHAIGLKRFVNIFTGDPEDVLARDELKDIEPVYVEVPRGGVAFHHALTFHLGTPNKSDRARRVHTVIYFRDGITRARAFAHPAVDRGGIEVGDVVDSVVTPIAWPRAEGDMPSAPPAPGCYQPPDAPTLNQPGRLPRA